MKTSIILLANDHLASLQNCLKNIQKYTEADTYELIIITHKKLEAMPEWLQGLSAVRILSVTENSSQTAAYNQGIALSSGDDFLLLNSDILVMPSWLNNLTACLNSHEEIGAVGPVINTSSDQCNCTENQFNPALWAETLSLAGHSLLIKRQLIQTIGLLDEEFSLENFTYNDYSFRIRAAGYKLMRCGDTVVYNQCKSNNNTALLPWNREKFLSKWGFDLTYSTSVRDDLIQFIDNAADNFIRVLEVGCACGNTLLQIKNLFPQASLYGIECNGQAAAIAKSVADVLAADIETTVLPYPHEFFDYIILGDVLEHLVNPWRVLENIKLYLKPAGHILAGLPNINHVSVIRSLLQGHWTYEAAGLLDKTHLRFFTLHEIEKMFHNAGYKICEYCPGTILESADDKNFMLALATLAGNLGLTEQYRAYNYRIKAANSTYKGKPRFVTLFPETENVHLIKDVGMIPYTMAKEFGYDAAIVTYKNGAYPYLDREVKGLRLEYLSQAYNDSVKDGLEYLRRHAQNIDILHIFHLIPRSYEWINLYKELNPQGKVYLKLDTTEDIKHTDIAGHEGTRLLRLFKKCHVISVESRQLHQYLNDHWPIRVEYITNGFYESGKTVVDYQEKENTILTVGRIGTFQKHSELLLEAFKLAHTHMPNWKLKLVGPVVPEFSKTIATYFAENPQLQNKVLFTGELTERSAIVKEYQQAKIFCLTSRWEGFPIVFPEAAIHGCYIISSDLVSAWDITKNQQFGDVFPIGNSIQLAQLLIQASANETRLKAVCSSIQQFALQHFHWSKICQRLQASLSTPVPQENADIAEIRKLTVTVKQNTSAYNSELDRFLVDRLENYPIAFKLPFWEKHNEYLALRQYPELAGSLLDFGCGTGHMDILLAREGRRICGIDISPLGIAAANYFRSKEKSEVQEQVHFLTVDVTNPDNSNMLFDAVWAVQVFEYIKDPEPILIGLRRWVKPGAHLLLSVSLGHAYYDPDRIHTFFDAAALESFLQNYISVVRIDTVHEHNMLRALCKFSD